MRGAFLLLVASATAFSACRCPRNAPTPGVVAPTAINIAPVPAAFAVCRRSIVIAVEAPRSSWHSGIIGRIRSVWAMCDEQLCRVDRPRPIEFVRRLIPKRRPLKQLRMCDAGVLKVKRTEDGSRQMYYAETPKEECNLEEAMDMF